MSGWNEWMYSNSNTWMLGQITNWRFLGTWQFWFGDTASMFSPSPLLQRSQWTSDLSEQSVKLLSVWGLKVVRQAHPISTLPWSTPKPTSWPVQPPLPLPPNDFALRGLVCCRTRLCCVHGGNASPLSIEQLFDDGPCWTSLWFKSLQRAGLHMVLAYY